MPSGFGDPDDEGDSEYENGNPFSPDHPANRAAREYANRPDVIAARKRREAELMRNPDPLFVQLVRDGAIQDDDGRTLTMADLGPIVICPCCGQRVPQ